MVDSNSESRALELETLLPRLMRRLYRPSEHEPLADLPVAQLRMMRVLFAGATTVSALGEELALTPSAVTQMANRLQEAGLVERTEDLVDRRVKHLSLTRIGLDKMNIRRRHRVERAETVLSRLTPIQQQQVMTSLHTLIAACGDETREQDSLVMVAELENALPEIREAGGGYSKPLPKS